MLAPPQESVDIVRQSLEAANDKWFTWLLISSGIVALGCLLEIGETWTDLARWVRLKRKLPVEEESSTSWHTPIGAIGLLLVIAGVVGEGVFEGLAAKADTALRTHNSQMMIHAQIQADDAKTSADKAANASSRATESAQVAGTIADHATAASEGALGLAVGARKEADSFEHDIVAAKKQAAAAESHLAEALARAAQASAELNRLRSPRVLSDVTNFVRSLESLKGTEYTFNAVAADEEAFTLLRSVDAALQSAGWKRVNPPPGFPAINVYGAASDFSPTQSLSTGISISVDSPEAVEVLTKRPENEWPAAVRAAVRLDKQLFSSITPAPDKMPLVNIIPNGKSLTVRIDIGKKP